MMKLITKTVQINKKNVTVSLESEYWEILKEISKLEKISRKELLEIIFRTTNKDTSVESSIKSFVYKYYRLIAIYIPTQHVIEYRKKLSFK